jgi:tRNA threonylcarbamoyl adenosine modification protein YeaZ
VLVLVIDTSSAATTAALVTVAPGPVVTRLAQRVNVDARAHGEVLAPAIAAVLAEAGAAPGDLAAIVAGVGPGPYTGLRVGLVTAAAFGQARSVPTYGVCSLDGIGIALAEPRLLVAGDARRREVYWAGYADGERTAGPDVAAPADVVTAGFTAAAGAGARLYADVLGLPLLDLDYPDPVALARVAADRVLAAAPSEALTPLYLRRPDAVEPAARKPVRT